MKRDYRELATLSRNTRTMIVEIPVAYQYPVGPTRRDPGQPGLTPSLIMPGPLPCPIGFSARPHYRCTPKSGILVQANAEGLGLRAEC